MPPLSNEKLNNDQKLIVINQPDTFFEVEKEENDHLCNDIASNFFQKFLNPNHVSLLSISIDFVDRSRFRFSNRSPYKIKQNTPTKRVIHF